MTWDYKFVNHPDSLAPMSEDQLKRLGRDGWELVQVFPSKIAKGSMQGQPSTCYLFKKATP